MSKENDKKEIVLAPVKAPEPAPLPVEEIELYTPDFQLEQDDIRLQLLKEYALKYPAIVEAQTENLAADARLKNSQAANLDQQTRLMSIRNNEAEKAFEVASRTNWILPGIGIFLIIACVIIAFLAVFGVVAPLEVAAKLTPLYIPFGIGAVLLLVTSSVMSANGANLIRSARNGKPDSGEE